jgi:predicted nucleic acid-binding protein
MSDDVFLDTNILVYATAKGDPRAATAIRLLSAGGVVSVQVLNEFTSVARHKLKWSWPEVIRALAEFRILLRAPQPITLATHEMALEIAQQDGLGVYDALIVASALEAGCTMLLSEDMQDGRVIDGRLRNCNPFNVAPTGVNERP